MREGEREEMGARYKSLLFYVFFCQYTPTLCFVFLFVFFFHRVDVFLPQEAWT